MKLLIVPNFQKSLIFLNLLLIATITFLFFSPKKEKTNVFINSPKLLSQYKGMVEVQKQVEKMHNNYKSKVDTLASELQQAIKNYEKERASLSKKESLLSEEVLRNKQQQLQQYQQTIQQKAQAEQQEMEGKVLKEVNEFINGYAKEHDYQFIFAANNAGSLIYAEPALDITDAVLEKLNHGSSK